MWLLPFLNIIVSVHCNFFNVFIVHSHVKMVNLNEDKRNIDQLLNIGSKI